MTTQPSNVPSAQSPLAESPLATITGEWECAECGYIEEGVETRRPAQCPECDAPAESLEFYAYEDDDWEADMDELALLDADDEDLDEDEEFEDDEDAL